MSQHRYILCPLVCAPCLGLTQLALASPSNAAFAPLVGTPRTSSPPLFAASCMCSCFCITPQCFSFPSLTAGTCFNIQRLFIAPLSALAIPRPYAHRVLAWWPYTRRAGASLTVSLLFLPCAFVLFPPTTLLQSKDFCLPLSALVVPLSDSLTLFLTLSRTLSASFDTCPVDHVTLWPRQRWALV